SMSPESVYVNMLVVVESFVDLGGVAISAGLLYAKFSRPTARVAFSEPFVVLTRNGRPCMMFRVANQRASHIVEARLTLTALMDEVTDEGQTMRRLVSVPLERSESPMFLLSWTAMHYLDEGSPLAFLAEGRWEPACRGLLVSLTGMEAGFSQQVHVRTSYFESSVRFNHDFLDMVRTDDDGTIELDVSRIHLVEPMK
ncbi:MAG: inward rectifier potassium channel, partial [Kiritimatiellia bacterium]